MLIAAGALLFLCGTAGRSDGRSSSRLRHGSGPGSCAVWSRAAQVPDRISDPQILDSFRFPGFPQQRSLSGGKQRRNSASSEEAPAAQLPRPGGVGCCVEKTAALSDLKTCTTSGICDSVLDSSVALPDALTLSRGSPVQAVWTPRTASPSLATHRETINMIKIYNLLR